MSDQTTALDLPLATPLPEATRAYFDTCQQKLGLIPNVLLAYAHDIAKLDAFILMYNNLMLAPGGLTKLEREMVAVAVSSENGCYYCQVAHGAAVRVMSGTPELGEALVMNHAVAEVTPRQRAMIDFALLMTNASASIDEMDRQELRDHGLSDEDIWDLAAVVGFFNMSNRIASATGMKPNPEYHAQGR